MFFWKDIAHQDNIIYFMSFLVLPNGKRASLSSLGRAYGEKIL